MLIDVHTHQQNDRCSILSLHAEDFLQGNFPTGFYTAGLHPWYADESKAQRFCNYLEKHKPENLIAIGECGLDRVKGPELSIQEKVFKHQLDVAHKLKLPVIIHQVKSLSDIFPFIKSYANIPFVLHGFQGNIQQLHQLLDYNVYFSFGKAILHASSKLQKVLTEVPLERVFFETDETDCKIKSIYDNFAAFRTVDVEELEVKVEHNFTKVFKKRI